MSSNFPPYSPLDLFHPNGSIKHALTIGTNKPVELQQATDLIEKAVVDLILFSPTSEECRNNGWLESSIQEIQQRLDSNGIVFVVIPVSWRTKVENLLKETDLRSRQSYIHLPDWESSRYIIPIKPCPASYVLNNFVPVNRLKRSLFLLLLKLPGGESLLSRLLPGVSVVYSRSQSAQPFDWLSGINNSVNNRYTTLTNINHKDSQLSCIVQCFSEGEVPIAVIKVDGILDTPDQRDTEITNLETVGKSASEAGVQIPNLIQKLKIGNYLSIVENVVLGKSGAVVLSEHPGLLSHLIEKVTEWLILWNKLTLGFSGFNDDLLEKELFIPLEQLQSLITVEKEYINWIKNLADGLHYHLPFVAVHQDLTTWNMLLDKHDQLGIVDWSEANSKGLPFVDFYYAIVDSVAVAAHVDHEQAFSQCFIEQGNYAKLARGFLKQISESLQISGVALDICLHACFIHHALNEQQNNKKADHQPFLSIVERLIRERVMISQNI